MANTIINRLRTAWNVFRNKEIVQENYGEDHGYSTSSAPFRHRMHYGNEQSIVNAVFTRCAIDVSNINFKHVRTDENGNFTETIESGLNSCLTLSSNIDQSHMSFIQDVVVSMFDEGVVAIVPVDTTTDLRDNSFDILSLRTGRIKEWFPHSVRLEVYNDGTGRQEELILPKDKVGIIENPFYSVMNQPNSISQRLTRKLNLLDVIDEQSASGKLDVIIQLPYAVKTETRRKQAEERRNSIEEQLKGTKYGIAYADATEKITQLNRPVENNLLGQIEFLTKMLYGQLGISEKILDGTASEEELLNYYNRTIEPIASAIAFELRRKFLTQTAISQGQSIMFFRDVFSIITAKDLAELADKLTRNEVVSGNEFRAVIGYKPSSDPRANELRNKNMPDPNVPKPVVDQPVPINIPNQVKENSNAG